MKNKKPVVPPPAPVKKQPESAPKKMVVPVGGVRPFPPHAQQTIKEALVQVDQAQRELGAKAMLALQADTQMRQAAQALELKQEALMALSKKILNEMGEDTVSQSWNVDFSTFEAKRVF